MTRTVSGEKQNTPLPTGYQCVLRIEEDKNHEATVVFTLDFFFSLPDAFQENLGNVLLLSSSLKKSIYTNGIKKERRQEKGGNTCSQCAWSWDQFGSEPPGTPGENGDTVHSIVFIIRKKSSYH